MERADCEERLAPCQLQGCPPLAVILIMFLLLLLLLLLLMMMIHYLFPLTHAHLPCPSKLITFETKICRTMHFVLEEMWQQAPALDTSGPTLADLLLAMDFSRAW